MVFGPKGGLDANALVVSDMRWAVYSQIAAVEAENAAVEKHLFHA